MQIDLNYTVDIAYPVKPQNLKYPLYYLDSGAHAIKVKLLKNGEPLSLTSEARCYGFFLHESTDVTDMSEGNVEGDELSVVIPELAYATPGVLYFTIRVTDEGSTTTVLAVVANVRSTISGTVIDVSGTLLPNIEELIQAFEHLEEISDGLLSVIDSAAVRYDQAQTLTDAQKAQARTNIGAASLVPDGTAFSKAVQDGTAYDVQDARVAPLDERVNALHNLVNYGYDSPSNEPSGVFKSRFETKVVLDGTAGSAVNTRIILTGTPNRVTSNIFPSDVTTGIALTPGHRYRLYTIAVSGTKTNDLEPRWIAPGSWDAPQGVTNGDGYSILDYTAEAFPNGVLAMITTQSGNVFSNYTVQVIAEDITNREAEPLDLKTNALHGLVNYGYDEPFSGTLSPYDIKRNGTIVQVNGGSDATSSTPARICLTGDITLTRSSSAPSIESGVKLESGHRYRITRTRISGTATNLVYPYPAYVGVFSRLAGNIIYSGDVSYYDFTFTPLMDENDNVITDEVLISLSIKRATTGNVLTNYVCSVTLEDITYGAAEDGNFAPVDTPTATSAHTTGSLLMMGSQLYKATADIESGNTITPGTNVTETSVAAELAARDTAITALQNPPGYVHMSDLSAYGTDGVFTPDGDSDLEITLTVPYNGDTRNQIYTCIAKYERAGGVTVWPTIVFRYGNTLNRTTSYTIGGNGCFETKQWRVIRYPGVTTTLTIVITIPVGVTVTIRDFYNEYSDAVSRTPHGIRINGHRQYLPNTMNPDTIPGVMMAIKCGTCSMIQIPKRLSDGTWIFYHDDSLVYNDTYIRQADGTELPSTYNGTLWSNITPEEAYSWDWGITRGALFAGTKPMTMEQFFTICGKTGIMPMLSMHPWPTDAELGEIKAIASKCGVLNRLGIKCTVTRIGTAYSIFGNDIESYTIDVSSGTQAQSVVEAAITAMNGLTGCTVRRVIELFASTAYNAYFGTTQYDAFKLIADAGYGCALASQTGAYHPTLPNYTSVVMKASDFEFWQGKGVSEYTYEYGWSNGLNW